MTTQHERNQQVIAEFRATGGRVGGRLDGTPLLLLTTIGAKSGRARITPLAYLPDGDRFLIFASHAGAPTHPDWYHNLRAHPDVTVEVGTETIPVTAVELTGAERDRWYAEQAQRIPRFGEYQQQTSRRIPVLALYRRPA